MDDLSEGPAVDELHGVVVHAAITADREDRHDVGVVQLSGGVGLGAEPLELAAIEGRREREHLQGDPAPERDLPRLVDDTHASAADLANQLVIAQLG